MSSVELIVSELVEEVIFSEEIIGGQYSRIGYIVEQLVSGDVDGFNTEFSTDMAYTPGSLRITLNGVFIGTDNFSETTPSTGAFMVDVAPESDIAQTDEIRASYLPL